MVENIGLIIFCLIVAGVGWVIVDRAENGRVRRRVEPPAAVKASVEAVGWAPDPVEHETGQQIYARLRAAEQERSVRLAELKAGDAGVTGNWRGVVSLIRAGREGGSNKVNEDLASKIFEGRREG
jgi:hypothetical protein